MKKYFIESSEDICFPLSYWKKHYMPENSLKELELFEAEIEYGTGFFYCREFGEVGEVGESCGKTCRYYKPRNGKNGRCRFSSHLYSPNDKKIILKIK